MSIEQKIAELMAESEKFDAATVTENETPEINVAATEEVEEDLPVVEEKFDMTADVAALVEGENLSEEFKVKAAAIFEAAVLTRVKAEVSKLDEQYSAAFDTQLEEAVAVEVEGLIEQVDGYLSYMAEQWMKDNEIALESGLKTEILEGFVSGLKGLFEEHYIDVPEGSTDIVTEMESIVAEKEYEVQGLTEKLNESEQRNIELSKTLAEKVRADLIEAKTTGLADTDAEKFKDLASELIFEGAESFDKKLKVIRENYFDKRVTQPASSTFLTEGEAITEAPAISRNMAAYTKALTSTI